MLFSQFSTRPEQIRAAAVDLFTGSRQVLSVEAAVAGAHGHAVSAVEGLLTEPMSEAVRPVSRGAGVVSAAASVAGGALNLFAEAVAAYNAGVDRLNERYAAARAANFYVEPVTAAPSDNLTAGELQRRYDSRVQTAGGQLEFQLRLEEAALRSDLDSAAEITAAVLNRGPSAAMLDFLVASGALPTSSGIALTGLGADDDDDTVLWAPGPIESEWSDDANEDDDRLLPDWLHSAADGISNGAGWTWNKAGDGASWTADKAGDGASWAWDKAGDGAGWVWRHGGEPSWDFVAGDAIDSCREDTWSVDCAFNAVTTLPVFKAGKAFKYGDDVIDLFKRGDDARDTVKTVDKAKDATKPPFNGLGPVQRGRQAMEQLGLKQNTKVLRINGRDRIPDVFFEGRPPLIGEVKNVSRLHYSRQLRDYADFARERGIKLDLYVRGAPNPTKLSGPLKDAVRAGDIRLLRRIH